MAVGLGVAESCDIEMTDKKCKRLMLSSRDGLSLNPMKGIEGEFYRSNRKKDLLDVCLEILEERNEKSTW